MSVSDILDGAFKLLKANAATIMTIVAVLVVPWQIVSALAQRHLFGGSGLLTAIRDPSVAASSHRSSLSTSALYFGTAVNLLLLPFVAGAISKVVAASYVGNQLGPMTALRMTLRRSWALLAAWFLVHLAEIIGLVFCVFPLVVMMTLFVLTAPAIVTEELGPIAGMRRSWRLVSRRFWPTMGITLLAGLIASVLGNTLGGVPTGVALFIGLRWGWILLALGNSLTSLLVTPIVAIIATLQYFDARIRTEAFDLQIIAAGLSSDRG